MAMERRRLSVGVLNIQLTCVLCGGYLIDATSLTECLHRFCRSCIVKYLKENRLCPICDAHIPEGKEDEHLRSDEIFQTLVYKLVPGLYQREMAARRQFYSNSNQERPEGEAGGDLPVVNKFFSPEDSISLSLEYYKSDLSEGIGEKMYLKCAASVLMRHLIKWLKMKHEIDGNSYNIDIIHQEECLPSHFTLMDVAYTYKWNQAFPLELSYRIYPKAVHTSSPQLTEANPATQPSLKLTYDPHQRQRQSEYLGHLNLNPKSPPNQPKTNGPDTEKYKKDYESDSASSELKIVSEKDTAGPSSDDEYIPKNLKKLAKRKRHDNARKSHQQKRRKSESFSDVPQRKIVDDKKRRSLYEDFSEKNDLVKNEALKKVFVYKDKAEVTHKRKDDIKRKKRKKSKHHEGETKKRRDHYASPSITSVDKNPLKLKVKLTMPKPKIPNGAHQNLPAKVRTDEKNDRDLSLTANLRAIRKPGLPKKDFINAPPSLTISKVGVKDQNNGKTSLVESKPSLEIMLVKKSTEAKTAQNKMAEPKALDLSEKANVLDLSKPTRFKDGDKSPVEKSPNKSTQQSILQIAETLVNRKLSPTPDVKTTEQSMAVVAMRDLKTLSDAAVNILMAAKTQAQDVSNGLKIPVFPRERSNPIPPVPNLHEIFPRSRIRPLASPVPLIKPNQTVRQIPDPSVILNRQNNLRQQMSRPDSSTSPGKVKAPVPPLLKKIPSFEKKDTMMQHSLKNAVTSTSPMRLQTPVRRPEMSKNIESVAAGLTARATALIDAK